MNARRRASVLIALAIGLPAAAAAEVVAVVSARSTAGPLSRIQVANIFLGKASHFPDGSPAVPIDLADGSAARDEFYVKFAGKSPAQVTAYWSRIVFTGQGQPPPDVANGMAMKRRLQGDPAAIGYLEHELVDATLKVVLTP